MRRTRVSVFKAVRRDRRRAANVVLPRARTGALAKRGLSRRQDKCKKKKEASCYLQRDERLEVDRYIRGF